VHVNEAFPRARSLACLRSCTVIPRSCLRLNGAQEALGTEEGKQMVLYSERREQCQYLVKLPQADKLEPVPNEGVSKEKVSSWGLERLGTVEHRRQFVTAWHCAQDFAVVVTNPATKRPLMIWSRGPAPFALLKAPLPINTSGRRPRNSRSLSWSHY
jgi:hypothetical protein